jgi:hypothetical protein
MVGKRGGDDRLVERGQQHAEHEPSEHDPELLLAERTGLPGARGVRLDGLRHHRLLRVLLQPRSGVGCAGEDEAEAVARLPGQRPSGLPAGRHLGVPASWK